MSIAMYLRKSRSDDRDEPTAVTLSRHRRILEQFASDRQLCVDQVYEEVVSGESILARPRMLQLLQEVAEHRYDAVLCLDIDRLGRGGMKDQGVILETFQYSGTKIITPEKTYDLDDDLDEELTEFKTFLSRREYKMINKRLRRGLLESIRDGAYVSNAPYGYRRAHCGKLPTLEPVEEEAQFVRMIFDLYVNQRIGSERIAQMLNALGAVPRRTAQFSRSAVRGILQNPTYVGTVAWNRVTRRKSLGGTVVSTSHPPEEWLTVPGLHPALIDDETFRRAQALRSGHQLPSCHEGGCKSALAGIVTCGVCGQKMQLQCCRNRWRYLRCARSGCCGSARFDDVEEALLECLREPWSQLLIPDRPIADLPASPDLLRVAERECVAIRNRRTRLLDLFEQEIYSAELFRERMDALDARLSRGEHQLLALRAEREQALARPIPKTQRSVLDCYQSADASLKNSLLKASLAQVIYRRNAGRGQPFTLEVTVRSR